MLTDLVRRLNNTLGLMNERCAALEVENKQLKNVLEFVDWSAKNPLAEKESESSERREKEKIMGYKQWKKGIEEAEKAINNSREYIDFAFAYGKNARYISVTPNYKTQDRKHILDFCITVREVDWKLVSQDRLLLEDIEILHRLHTLIDSWMNNEDVEFPKPEDFGTRVKKTKYRKESAI